jgi:hypothetical protein
VAEARLADRITEILKMGVPKSVQADFRNMKANPVEWARNFQVPTSADTLGIISGAMPIAGMAKVFKPSNVNSVESLLQKLIAEGSGLRRSSLLPAVKLGDEVISGGLGSGHGNVYEAISPQMVERAKRTGQGIVEGYVPSTYPNVFLNRDQGTIASGSVDSIKILLNNLLAKPR